MSFLTTGSINTFVAGTKARASQVNSNFQTYANFFNSITSDILIGAAWQRVDSTAAAHTILSTDALRALLVDVNTSLGYTCVLPTASASQHRWLYIKNIGQTTGALTLDGVGSEQIDNTTTIALANDSGLGLFCNGTKWVTYNYDNAATSTRQGLVSTGTQSFGGTKTFLGGNFRLAVAASGLGNASAPYWTPSDDTDTGIFFLGANQFGIAVAGIAAMQIATGGQITFGNVTASTNSTINFHADAEFKRAITSGVFTQIQFYDGSNDAAGNISTNATANTTAYNTSSDERLKTKFASFDALKILSQIEALCYERICDPGTLEYGVKAQQLNKIYPSAVTPGGDDPKKHPWGVDYSKLVGLLLGGVQQLLARIVELEKKVKT